jgi:rhomboid family GlyGly-CTERM serine protease
MTANQSVASLSILLRQFALPLAIIALVTIIELGGSAPHDWLRYDRTAILHGEVWRLLSAHLTHLGWSHLFMNVLGLLLIWFLFGQVYTTRHWLCLLVIGGLCTSLALMAFNPELRWYVGLSGVLHTLFIAAAIQAVGRSGWEAYLLLAFVVIKLTWEQIAGPLPGSEASAGGRVIVDAHLYGALAGFAYAAVLRLYNQQSNRTRN